MVDIVNDISNIFLWRLDKREILIKNETYRPQSWDEKECRPALMDGWKILLLWRGFFITPWVEKTAEPLCVISVSMQENPADFADADSRGSRGRGCEAMAFREKMMAFRRGDSGRPGNGLAGEGAGEETPASMGAPGGRKRRVRMAASHQRKRRWEFDVECITLKTVCLKTMTTKSTTTRRGTPKDASRPYTPTGAWC